MGDVFISYCVPLVIFFLHRREMALQGTGKIGIGIQISEAEAVSLLGYRLEQH